MQDGDIINIDVTVYLNVSVCQSIIGSMLYLIQVTYKVIGVLLLSYA